MASQKTWIQLKNEGAKHFKNQRWLKASDCYTRALTKKPDEAILYSNRAICKIQLKKFDPAREDAERAVRLDPKNVKFYRVLSEALLGLGSHAKALEVCEKGLKLQPQEPTLLARLQDCKSKISGTNHQSQHSGCQKRKNANASQPIDEIQGCSTEKKARIEFNTPTPDDVGILLHWNLEEQFSIAFALGLLHPNSYDEKGALHFFELSAKHGNPRALYHLGLIHYLGKAGLPSDPQKALQCWKKAISNKPYYQQHNETIRRRGVAESENAIGNAYRDGKGVQQSDAEAFKWYQKAAKHGSPESCVNLAVFLNAGRGCQRDPAAAKACFMELSECDEDEFDWEGMYTPRRDFFIPSDYEDSSDEEEGDDQDSECDQWSSDSEDTDLEEEYCNDPKFEMAAFFKSFEGLSGSCVNHSPVMHDARLLIPAMKDRHQRGWPSAKIFLETVNKMHEAHELLRQKKYTESFVKIREMDSTWVLGILDMMPFLEAANNVLKRDPNNHAAMYIIIIFDPCQESKLKLKFSKRCVQLDSSVPQYHEVLALSYAAINQGNLSVRSLEKGIKLHAKPSMLSFRAVLIKNLINAKDEVVIEAFQQFLASAPSDYENVPSTYFQMGLLFTNNNPAKAAALYRLGQMADHSSIRLPCFADMGDDEVRLELKMKLHGKGYWPIPGNILDCVKMCLTCTKTDSLSPCTTCNKAWYCSRQCQENNRIIHKKFCHH
jgi:TPR repeat protein